MPAGPETWTQKESRPRTAHMSTFVTSSCRPAMKTKRRAATRGPRRLLMLVLPVTLLTAEKSIGGGWTSRS